MKKREAGGALRSREGANNRPCEKSTAEKKKNSVPTPKPKGQNPLSYCELAKGHPIHGPYHDNEYGFPSDDERVLFERLALEIMQAGLSWETVLKKRAALRKAFAQFEAREVARFGPADVERLLLEPSIIRNRRKIEAILENARRIEALPKGGFAGWLKKQGPLERAAWVRLFKKTFVFMGPEIVGEFLMSLGLLPGAHRSGCPVLEKIKEKRIQRSGFCIHRSEKNGPRKRIGKPAG